MAKTFGAARALAIAVVVIGVVQLGFALLTIVDAAQMPSRLMFAVSTGGVADAMRTIAFGAILGVLARIGADLAALAARRVGDDASWTAPGPDDVARAVRGG